MSKTRDKLINVILIDATVPKCIQEKPYTAIEMIYEIKGHEFKSVAFSKVKWPDVYSEEFGYNLACLRATAKIAKKISEDKQLLSYILRNDNGQENQAITNSL